VAAPSAPAGTAVPLAVPTRSSAVARAAQDHRALDRGRPGPPAGDGPAAGDQKAAGRLYWGLLTLLLVEVHLLTARLKELPNHLLFTVAAAVNLPLTARALQTGLGP
jgi:hypothetical protein